ncbi:MULTISPECIES: hypothetical protein [Chryseobacterium]|uniref:Uncharacterized protein n=2 Tax=Chryseobacterium cucumeris TaxID=1813611 RepID=A0ABX9X6J8_9FLAO|nr:MULTISPECIES: hypothetical protein [Chryseobacterium]MDH5034925.1 hypothetical protein [Chryseobacterium cucumeris]RKE78720.1 hypothetical protein DEU39_2969 [Chryseobacterium sp. AG363]ROH92555.1 hypothetical protein EGI15_10000 [Chryseobacterium cucumeris]WNI35498.1 hypothetical protein RHP76_16140 [Chryseobacterium sp. SG20098]
MKNNILFLAVLLLCNFFYSQKVNDLDSLRVKFCQKNCKEYKRDLLLKNKGEINPGDFDNKYYERFSIPSIQRTKIFPFNEYDSIYIANPNFIKNVDEPRNYLDTKFHNQIRMISSLEKERLSNILFNYSKKNIFVRTGLSNSVGCDCIQEEYPKILLLFKRDGKFKKFIAFPDNGKDRYNFTDQEYQYFDWSMEKEQMILELFSKDILPDQNCK